MERLEIQGKRIIEAFPNVQHFLSLEVLLQGT